MLHRAERPVVLVLCALGFLASGFPRAGTVSLAQADDLSIRFDQIADLADAESPRTRIFARELAEVAAERGEALQWSNPALTYDLEDVGSSREWQVSLRKRFEMPLSRSAQKGSWDARLRSAEHRRLWQTESLLSELETGYVRLRLLDRHMERLAGLEELIVLTSGVAESRHVEGSLSGTERQLVRLAALSIDAEHRRVRREREDFAVEWRADMGIDPATEVNLVTPIAYESVDLAATAEYTALLEIRPTMLEQVDLARAWSERATAARRSLLPGLDLYAGFKSLQPDQDGFIAGVAIDLPLFDRKASTAALYETKGGLVEDRLAIFHARTTKEIEFLVRMIQDAQPALAAFAEQIEMSPPLTDTLLFAYREGSLTLDALLNAVQIESTALESYYRELNEYYRNIFRLEAITGESIVRIAP